MPPPATPHNLTPSTQVGEEETEAEEAMCTHSTDCPRGKGNLHSLNFES